MHFFSLACVCGVHCVMAKGVQTAGMVLAKLANTEPCFSADGVVLVAVPDIGLTYLTKSVVCAITWAHAIASISVKLIFLKLTA